MHAPMGTKARMFKVLAPIEKKDGTTFWMRVGSGFPGKDPTTFNLVIDAYPINTKMLHVRELDEEDLQPRKDRRGGGGDELPNPRNPNDLPF